MLVSAIMPTRGRPEFARQALACFESQTWPEKELVIVDDADAPSFPEGIERSDVQYHRLPKRLSIGAKRNICCARSAGEIIIHLDDDDFSAPGRFADQVERLIASGKAITAYHTMEFRNGPERWQYRGMGIGSSLCYTRDYWLAHPFADRDAGEDGQFRDATGLNGGRSIALADADALMWASCHAGNTSPRDFRNSEWLKL